MATMQHVLLPSQLLLNIFERKLEDSQAVSTARELCDDAVSAASLLRCSWHRSKVLGDVPVTLEITDDVPI